MNQHVTEHDLADAIETELADYRLSEPETFADFHRREMAKKKQAVANHKRELKSTLAHLAADRKAAKAAYEERLARIAEVEATVKAGTDAAVSEMQGMIGYHQTALDALPE